MMAGGEFITEQLAIGSWKVRTAAGLQKAEQIQHLVGPNSLDVTLGPQLLVPNVTGIVDMPVLLDEPQSVAWEQRTLPYALRPGECALAAVEQAVECTTDTQGRPWVQVYDGRSTCGRLFIQSHMTAGFGDWGFRSAFTLELLNSFVRPIMLVPGMRIGQIYFHQLDNPRPYTGAYGDTISFDPVPPRLGPGRF